MLSLYSYVCSFQYEMRAKNKIEGFETLCVCTPCRAPILFSRLSGKPKEVSENNGHSKK